MNEPLKVDPVASDELTKSAAMYRTTDTANAEALDRTYPGAKR